MKTFLSCIAAVLIFTQCATAQTIVAAEYFLNTDPGPGLAHPIAITPGLTIDQTFQPINALPEGIHLVYVRVKGNSGIWSNTRAHQYFSTTIPNTNSQIIAAEYFFDNDAGPGNATPISITPSEQIDINILLSQNLTEGIHHLYIRTKSAQGIWGHTRDHLFYCDPHANNEQIVAAEYYIDSDPGAGNGSPVAVTPAGVVSQSFAFMNPYDSGIHTLYVRVKAADGIWSSPKSKTYNACTTYGPSPLYTSFISGKNIIFNNQSTNYTSFQWDFADGFTSATEVNPTHTYNSVGDYNVCLTVTNSCGTDQLCRHQIIRGLQNIFPNQSSTTSSVYISSNGFGFVSGDVIKLQHHTSGTIINADWTNFSSIQQLFSKFTFNNALAGGYDIILESANGNDTIVNGFHLAAPNNLPPTLQVSGRTNVRNNRTSYHNVTISNPSNEPIFLFPLVISLPAGPTVNVLFPVYHDPLVPIGVQQLSQTVFYPYTDQNGVQKQIATIGITNIPPGGSVDVPLSFKASESNCYTVEFSQWVQNIKPPEGPCDFLSPEGQCALSLLALVPVVSCGISTFNLTCTVEGMIQDHEFKGLDLLENFGGAVADCVAGIVPELAVAQVLEKVDQATDIHAAASDCLDALTSYEFVTGERTICSNNSNDPNDKIGPQGRTPENYVNKKEPLRYSIYAENAESATLPAARIVITDTLDLNVLDAESIVLEYIQIGDTLIDLEVSSDINAQDISLNTLTNSFVRYSYSLDQNTGVMTHDFKTLDLSSFDLPEDPLIGFLPPNVNDSEGELGVHFSIKPKQTVNHLTPIHNQASIVFDDNAPIYTSNYLNTVDTVAPISSIQTLPFTSENTDITLHFQSIDEHATTKDYFLSVSENGGPFTLQFLNISNDSIVFHGNMNSAYQFKVQARDYANNLEAEHNDPDAQVTFTTNINRFANHSMLVFPNPSNGYIKIQLNANASNASVKLVDVTGKTCLQKEHCAGRIFDLDVTSLGAGIYNIILEENGQLFTTHIIKN